LAEEPEEDTKVPLGHGENGRWGRQYVRIEKVGEPEEMAPVVGRVELVGLVAVQTGFPDGSFSLRYLTLLLAAAAAGNGVRLGHVFPRLTSGHFVRFGL